MGSKTAILAAAVSLFGFSDALGQPTFQGKLATGPGRTRPTPPPTSPLSDREQVEANTAAFLAALGKGDINGALEFLDENFSGYTPTGEFIQGKEAYRAYLIRVRQLTGIGSGGSFDSRVTSRDLLLNGSKVTGTITTSNRIRTSEGRVLDWEMPQKINSVKSDGRWLLSSVDARMSMATKVTVAARALAGAIWKGGLTLRAPKAVAPDFDSDHGQQQAGAKAMSLTPLEARPQ